MNSLIQLSGKLTRRQNPSKGGGNDIPKNTKVDAKDIEEIIKKYEKQYEFWMKNNELINGALVNIEYKRIIPKSRRIKLILFEREDSKNYRFIRGAKYNTVNSHIHHVITYFIPTINLKLNIEKMEKCIKILKEEFNGEFSDNKKEIVNKIDFSKYEISKSNFLSIIIDCSVVYDVSQPKFENKIEKEQAVTFYDVDKNPKEILEKLKIEAKEISLLDDKTMKMDDRSLEKLVNMAPYLISMSVDFLENYNYKNIESEREHVYVNVKKLPEPSNEPTIGVLDTGFDDRVYFHKWVEYDESYIDDEIEINDKDKFHGTEIDSIIVDGPSNNPELDDGCGRFKVRHFCISTEKASSTFTIMRKIDKIVKNNIDIKVWNLSLGSKNEINDNFISQVASLIDTLENKYDVLFVIAGTNLTNEDIEKKVTYKKIGSPADSINSIVVNSVKRNGEKVSYARKGNVLKYFNKPDICYYGGDKGEEIRTCNANGEHLRAGTSFAAPWIARKVAYLIYKIGLPREIAKALIIDSASGWKKINESDKEYYGYGIVPIRIEEICNSQRDEIKFYIQSESKDYDTYSFNIPVPIYDGKYPYIAKATLCYFPKCTRNQGVDYTNTELDLYFGRLKADKKGNINIISINKNNQSDYGASMYEEDARKIYGKWNNTKHIVEEYKDNIKPRKVYKNTKWGLSVKSKDRLGERDGNGIKFGVVITLKELNGVNRFDEFVRQCNYNGWIVNKIDVENRLDLYNTAEEKIEFD